MTGAHDKPLQHLHSYRKHNLCGAFICWSYLACVAGVNGREEGKARMEGGGHEEVASSKFNTSIQKSIPYL